MVLPGQGPSFFGADFVSVSNVETIDGKSGHALHFGVGSRKESFGSLIHLNTVAIMILIAKNREDRSIEELLMLCFFLFVHYIFCISAWETFRNVKKCWESS